jgi:cephalosporin-C deacetylase-like acetyl esterase
MALIEKTPLDLKVTPWKTLKGAEIGQYNITSAALPEDYDTAGEKYQQVEVYKVDFAAANGKRVYGWFAKPPGPGPFPAMLVLPGAGNNPRPAPVEHARHGYAALDVNVHNSQVDLPTKADYPSPPYTAPFTVPENYWAFDVYCNALQAVNALAKLPGADPNRIVVMGGSQGGRATVIVAAMHPKVKAAIAAIAHFGNVPWNNWTARLNEAHDSGNRLFTRAQVPDDAQTRVESYFDIMNFAPYIHCRFLMNSGLDDPVSPPTAVFGVFRSVPSTHKQLVPLPNMSHDFSPGFDTFAWRWLDKQWSQIPAAQ